jgi:ribosomal protein L22
MTETPENNEETVEETTAPEETAPAAETEAETPAAEAEAEPSQEPEVTSETGAETETATEDAPKRSRRRRSAEPADTAAPAEKRSQPAPTRRRSRREPGVAAPVVRAQARYVRSSARKARLVCDHIRGKSVEEARAILAVTPRAIARDWSKLLESAVANAEHNHELVGEDLYVKAVHADEGPTIKRFRPRAMGRATAIRKRTSHLTILLTPKN